MKKIFTLLLFIFLSNLVFAQYVVNFEGTGETKTAYASGSVSLSGINWDMTEALIGTDASDWKNGFRSARMRGYGTSSMTMEANKTTGAGQISFYYRRYGTDAQVDWKVEYSTNDGGTWTQIGSNFTAPASDVVQTFSETLNISGNIRFRIKRATESGTSNRRLNIDDITITDYVISGNDNDSEVDGPVIASQPNPILISSLIDSDPESVRVFDFDIWDYGTSDGFPTIVTMATIIAGSNNTANWANTIAGAKLSIDGGITFVTTNTPVISANSIVFGITPGNLNIADSDAQTVSLFIYFKNTGLTDNSTLEFSVATTAHGFAADASGSQFATTMGGATSNELLIDVEGTELRFVQQPSHTNVNVAMTPAVTVEATDANGNRDTDITSSISITSTGSLSGSPVSSAAVLGLVTFSTLTHTVMGSGLTLNAERSGTLDWDVSSNTFNIVNIPTVDDVRINEVDSDTPSTDVAEFVELYGTPGLNLTGLVVVFFNGNGDVSYYAADLDGFYLDANGYLILGNEGAPGNPEITFNNGVLQNGADAVALYYANGSDFPNGTSTTMVNLIDALVYDTGQADDSGLLNGVGQIYQINEDQNGKKDTESIQRTPTGWTVRTPTPRGEYTLPLVLLGLNVEVNQKQSIILWKTTSEINTSHFEIERATEANLFKGIGKVLAAVNSSEERSYAFTDEKPMKGHNYYRLKMIDQDGTFRYSDVVSAYFGNTHTGLILSPNLVHSSLKISFEEPVENGRILIYGLDGKLMNSYFLAEGIDVLRVDVSGLPSGQYLIQYQSDNGSETVRFVKE